MEIRMNGEAIKKEDYNKVISVIGQKGGVSKTTVSLLISQKLAELGFSVLGVDMDAQRNFSLYAGVYETPDNVYTVLTGNTANIENAITNVSENFDILNGSTEMKKWNSASTEMKAGESRLDRALKTVKNKYDYIVIDNPPALDEATINSMVASDEIIIPTEAKLGSVNGILEFQQDYEEVKDLFYKPNLKILGILPTKVERGNFGLPKKKNAREHIKSLKEIAEELGTSVFDMFISNHVEYEELAENHVNYFQIDRSSVPKKEVDKLVELILEKEGVELCQ